MTQWCKDVAGMVTNGADVTFAGTNKNIVFDQSEDELNIGGKQNNFCLVLLLLVVNLNVLETTA